jgi:hypothetical protein
VLKLMVPDEAIDATNAPRVSVLMPVYDGGYYLAEAVDSILRQTLSDLELVAVDDGSTDGSAAWLESRAQADSRVIVLQVLHGGVTRALNFGLQYCRAPLIARMDADDMARPDRLARQVAFLNAHPEVVAVGSWVRRIDADGDVIAVGRWPESHHEIERDLLRGRGGLPHPTSMIRRRALLAVGGYCERFPYAQDKDLWLRLAEQGRLANVPEPLLDYREHARSISWAKRPQQCDQLRQVLDETFRRRGLGRARVRALGGRKLPHVRQIQREWIRAARRAGNFRTAWKHAHQLLRDAWYHPATWWLVGRLLLQPSGLLSFIRHSSGHGQRSSCHLQLGPPSTK